MASSRPTSTAPLFFDSFGGAAPGPRQSAMWEKYGNHFSSRQACDEFFSYMITPASSRWAFRPVGKTATTAALSTLFHLEFGSPLTADLNDPDDINEKPMLHRLTWHGVFRRLIARDDYRPDTYLNDNLYIATVRNPCSRAVSGFRYLCESQKRQHKAFAPERSRLCAATGFDWNKHANTPEGFQRFLDYIAMSIGQSQGMLVNGHWRPQTDIIRPDLFRPDLVGRAENLGEFFHSLAEHLGNREFAAEAVAKNYLNAQPKVDISSFIEYPGTRQRLRDCYSNDFEEFGYDI